MARRNVEEGKFLEVLRPVSLVYTVVSNKRPTAQQVSAPKVILHSPTNEAQFVHPHLYTHCVHAHTGVWVLKLQWFKSEVISQGPCASLPLVIIRSGLSRKKKDLLVCPYRGFWETSLSSSQAVSSKYPPPSIPATMC